MNQTPKQMREDALAWSRAGYPAVAVGRYRDAADQVQRLLSALKAAEEEIYTCTQLCGFNSQEDRSRCWNALRSAQNVLASFAPSDGEQR